MDEYFEGNFEEFENFEEDYDFYGDFEAERPDDTDHRPTFSIRGSLDSLERQMYWETGRHKIFLCEAILYCQPIEDSAGGITLMHPVHEILDDSHAALLRRFNFANRYASYRGFQRSKDAEQHLPHPNRRRCLPESKNV